jgi:hypothetical protein
VSLNECKASQKSVLEIEMINRNAFRVLGVVLAFLNISATARGDTQRAPELTFCQSTQVAGCILPTLTYELVARDLGRKVVYKFSADRPSLHAIIEAMDPNRLGPLPTMVLLRTASSFYRGQTIGHEFVYFGQEAKELEREKPLSLYPYATIINTSHVARSALLRIRQTF